MFRMFEIHAVTNGFTVKAFSFDMNRETSYIAKDAFELAGLIITLTEEKVAAPPRSEDHRAYSVGKATINEPFKEDLAVEL